MKKRKIQIKPFLYSAVFGIALISTACSESKSTAEEAVTSQESFKIYGNCGMCKNTIESSLKDVNGVEKAEWNQDTKMMSVSFDESIITLSEIKKKIANSGYDTEDVRASNENYEALHGCCQYERPN